MDPATAMAAIQIGSQIYSGLSAKKGQEDANRSEREFNAMEAQKQRDFEERMFGTRYQMTRRDLEAAGYNPLLAMGLNPSTPAGAAAVAHPKSERSEMAAIFSNTAEKVANLNLTRLVSAKTAAEAESAKAAALMHKREAEAMEAMPFMYKVKAFLNSLPGIGGMLGGAGVGAMIRGAGSAKQAGSIEFAKETARQQARRGRR